jgi:tetratricopeptide (TPR) repeat protein
MKLLTNRIVISLVVIVVVTYVWEFHAKPESGPIYTAAVNEYNDGNYRRSLELLDRAYLIDRNDASILALQGWNHLKLGDPQAAEPRFQRAYKLAPDVEDVILGYAYTELALGKSDEAARLLARLAEREVRDEDVYVARGTLLRNSGENLLAAEEFKRALEDNPRNLVALKNLREIYDVSGDPRDLTLEFTPLERPAELTYPARVQGDYLAVQTRGTWTPVFLRGVNLTAAMPGHFPASPGADPDAYATWLQQMKDLGANSVRVSTVLPPGFYRALYELNSASPQSPLWLIQGIAFVDPPANNLFDPDYLEACKKEIQDTIDALHGRGDMAASPLHPGGIYTHKVAPWVAGIVIGRTWPSHAVVGTDRRNAGQRSFSGTYMDVTDGSPTEVFLAQLLEHAAAYEKDTYNWLHPLAFLNWPTLDPMSHPTEASLLEEIRIRRSLGERVPTPPGPYANDDEVSLNPNHLRAQPALPTGYFAAYNLLPYYPDFLNHDPAYRSVRDAQGPNPFLGYVRDLKRNHAGLPLLITEFGIPSSLGIAHFNPVGFNEGGLTEVQQGDALARFTRNIFDARAAGGLVFEWLDQWYRTSWLVRRFETPLGHAPRWANLMDPSEHFGLVAVESGLRRVHRLSGGRDEWENIPPLYSEVEGEQFQPQGDRYDPARDLKAFYVAVDESFLYLRFQAAELDNDGDGQVDWDEANYLIGISTLPEQAGLTYLPFIAPIRFPMGMTYAIQLAGPELSRILVAETYNPFVINVVRGLPAQTELGPKLDWTPTLADQGAYESQIIEPNRRRFGRDRTYFAPQRYDRGILRFGSLDSGAADYDSLATWRANPQTDMVDLRIPWGLLNVTDPTTRQVFAGFTSDATVQAAETPGFQFALFAYRPRERASRRPIMEQGHTVADSLPELEAATSLPAERLKQYVWEGWEDPQYELRPKESYSRLRRAFTRLPSTLPGEAGAVAGR